MISNLILLALPLTCLAGPVSLGERSADVEELSTGSGLSERAPVEYPLDPGPAPGEFRYDGWDKDADKDTLTLIHSAFLEAQYMASRALLKLGDASLEGQVSRTRWFKDQDDPLETNKMFNNMYDPNTGHATDAVASMTVVKDDFRMVNGVPYCQAKPFANAYTEPDTGRSHICQKGLDKGLNADIPCTNLDAFCSLKMRSLSMTLIHEWTHYEKIGDDALGGIDTADLESGAYDCFQLDAEDASRNVQNYAWLAGEIHWGLYCSKTFEDPVAGIK